MCAKTHAEGRIDIKKNGGKLDFALPYYARNFHQDRKLSDLSDCRYFFIDRKLKANKKEMEDDLKYGLIIALKA